MFKLILIVAVLNTPAEEDLVLKEMEFPSKLMNAEECMFHGNKLVDSLESIRGFRCDQVEG